MAARSFFGARHACGVLPLAQRQPGLPADVVADEVRGPESASGKRTVAGTSTRKLTLPLRREVALCDEAGSGT